MTTAKISEVHTLSPRSASTFLRLLLVMPFLLSFALAAACGNKGGAPTASPETIARGNKNFLGTCATCHGKDANGLPKQGKSLLMNPFIMGKTDDELLLFVKTGRQPGDPLNTTGVAMPPRGGNPAFTDDDLKAVIAYLRTLQTLKS